MPHIRTPRAVANQACREAYRTRPRSLRVYDLMVAANMPTVDFVAKLMVHPWPATELNVARVQLLAAALGMPKDAPAWRYLEQGEEPLQCATDCRCPRHVPQGAA